MLWASSDFYKHFDRTIWADALQHVAVDYGAGIEVEDYYPQALVEAIEPPGPWRRLW
ncbi:hypothetical protein RFM98_14930 [Mesorhizobium sp. VK9D]|uniref:hypothetical protein n=1 Tax=Mesorhizobium australafricanum TaxID=3072311 RepID=UPI002A2491CF|nr:hypothetical protein [Mesorhizobium sp. VK9D]MDX8454054.1 hypothetical protein [Mesorhizobium sp. VK9D]